MAETRNFLFNVPGYSPLHDKEFTRNPAPPAAGDPVRIWITHRENGSSETKNAELIFVGKGQEKRQVHGKDVEPGWIIVLPVEGEYTFHAKNLTGEKMGVHIYVDGAEEQNKTFLHLFEHSLNSATFHMVKTDEDFELEPSKAVSMPAVPKNFGTIRVLVTKIDKVADEWRPARNSTVNTNPQKFGALKKEATTYLSKTVLPDKQDNHAGIKTLWFSGPTVWDFTCAYRGEAWAIVGRFLPKKYDEEDEESTQYSVSAAKRPKPDTPEETRLRETMKKLSYSSTCAEFFNSVAELLDREASDFDEIVEDLRRKNISDVAALAKLSDAQFLQTYMPSRYPVPVRRNMSNLIRQHIEPIPKPVIRISLDDD